MPTDPLAAELVRAAQSSYSAAKSQYAMLVSGGVATPQNVGNMTTTAPMTVANTYNAAMSQALGSFASAAQQAQRATAYIASVNPNAANLKASSDANAAALQTVAANAAKCSRSVLDPVTGTCCDPNSCSWNTVDWYVKASFIALTESVSWMTGVLVNIAQQALAVPIPRVLRRAPPKFQTPMPRIMEPTFRYGLSDFGAGIASPMVAGSSPIGLAFAGGAAAAAVGWALEEIKRAMRGKRRHR